MVGTITVIHGITLKVAIKIVKVKYSSSVSLENNNGRQITCKAQETQD